MLKGFCTFHSETGTEGGYWAFQDARYITKNVTQPYCRKCGKYLKAKPPGLLRVDKILTVTQEILNGDEPPECTDGQHEPAVCDAWSFEGFHPLRDGDHLTIFSPGNPSQVVWSGVISLKNYDHFTEHAFGMWIHSDQNGMDRETWATYFMKEYPAELIPLRKPQ